jgi:thiol-disulfide isomerase/thioredoxin
MAGQLPVSIHGTVKGQPAGKAKLLGTYGNQNTLVDSTTVDVKGGVRLDREIPYPGGLYYLVFDDNSYVSLMLGNDQTFSFKTVKTAINDSMKVEGCKDMELLYYSMNWEAAYQKRLDPITVQLKYAKPDSPEKKDLEAQRDKLLAEREAYIAEFRQYPETFFSRFKLMGQNPKLTYPLRADGKVDTLAQTQQYKADYWKGYDFTDDRLVRTPVFFNKLKAWTLSLTVQQPDSVIAAVEFLLARIPKGSEHFKMTVNQVALWYSAKAQLQLRDERRAMMMGSERVYVHMLEKYFTPELAFWDSKGNLDYLRREARYMKASMLGSIGQDLTYLNGQGDTETLYGLNAPATIVFIYSYTCEHCQEQAPLLAALHQRWKAKGLEVFAINMDPGKEEWEKFLVQKGMQEFHNFQDDQFMGGNVVKYYVDITPEIYVLDADHKIVAKDLHPDQLDEVLAQILK